MVLTAVGENTLETLWNLLLNFPGYDRIAVSVGLVGTGSHSVELAKL